MQNALKKNSTNYPPNTRQQISSNTPPGKKRLEFYLKEDILLSLFLLREIGFEEKGRIFINEKAKYSVDMLNPPLSVGRQQIKTVNAIEVDNMILELLTPTDSVKDRLVAFYFWNDRQAFEQAKLIQAYNEVDFDEIRKWSKMEGELEKFNYFIEKIKT